MCNWMTVRVNWSQNYIYGLSLSIAVCSEDANVTWSVPAASSQSEGYYACNASNAAGSASATTYLDVRGTTSTPV